MAFIGHWLNDSVVRKIFDEMGFSKYDILRREAKRMKGFMKFELSKPTF